MTCAIMVIMDLFYKGDLDLVRSGSKKQDMARIPLALNW